MPGVSWSITATRQPTARGPVRGQNLNFAQSYKKILKYSNSATVTAANAIRFAENINFCQPRAGNVGAK